MIACSLAYGSYIPGPARGRDAEFVRDKTSVCAGQYKSLYGTIQECTGQEKGLHETRQDKTRQDVTPDVYWTRQDVAHNGAGVPRACGLYIPGPARGRDAGLGRDSKRVWVYGFGVWA